MATQTSELIPFKFKNHQLRVQADENGNPWFCAKDACDILGYTNDSKAIKDHCKPEGVTNRYPLHTNGGIQYPTFINEGNLYRLIIKSNKPEAEPFESWVCDEVLPSIRKSGGYVKNALHDIPKRTIYLPLMDHEVRELKDAVSRIANYYPFHKGKHKPSSAIYAVLHERFGLQRIEHLNAADLPVALAILQRMATSSYTYYADTYGKEETALKALYLCAGLPIPPASAVQIAMEEAQ